MRAAFRSSWLYQHKMATASYLLGLTSIIDGPRQQLDRVAGKRRLLSATQVHFRGVDRDLRIWPSLVLNLKPKSL
jgi:hypothetical protein